MLPDVIELRRKFYEETPRYHLLANSVTDLSWIDRIATKGRPALVVAEGLFMYLTEADVKALIRKLQAAFPGCAVVFDAYSALTARNAARHPSLKKMGAVIGWGIDDVKAMESWGEGIQVKDEWCFTQDDAIDRLDPGYRLAFKLAGLFAAARKAHRLVYVTL